MLAINRMLRATSAHDADLTALELLRRTPLNRLEPTVKALKKHRSAAEVRQAMIELIAAAPLADFGALKEIYMAHCADAK